MSEYAVEMKNITKTFPGTKALDGACLYIKKGEVHALLGENGAGKSTLMNVLIGIHKMDSGEMFLNGGPLKINNNFEALRKGIGMVPQEINLIPDASIAENIFLGNERKNNKAKALIDWKDARVQAQKILHSLGVDIDVNQKVKQLSAAYQQMVSIARSLVYDPQILILDEPTSALTSNEANLLFQSMEKLKNEGKSLIFITHHLDEVMSQADRMTIMRDGKVVHVCDKKDITKEEIINKMANRDVTRDKKVVRTYSNEIFFKAENLQRENEYKSASFEVKRGEILCVAGLIGAGRTELFKTVFGLTNSEPGGKMYLEGKRVEINDPVAAIRLGIGYVPEERRQEGIFPILSVAENMTLPSYGKLKRHGLIDMKRVRSVTDKYIADLKVKTASQDTQIKNLSGGNQQKVILARWMAKKVRMLILDEPTRGIDVNAKDEIHRLIRAMADEGVTVIVISSEMEEVIALADRIMVMHKGEIKGFVENPIDVDEENILKIALA
ncbi:cellooligosaccharide ABC transporter ATP-binding protein [Christensenella hongkongensis]|uniref:Ribose ABC transport system, ATP-binding protein RbsA n=2 Tax=Christensenella hongkongensis TaxID=270498 RepID=A0A0M2NH92_9FIRM|nr:Ribose ABC transport system, ATP-binding protein RbsA [Christensenella hongkongensis]TCW24532.1 cellooligosaccharide ABC transporter ATP-binding protein [Christensenella hongkongensis]